MSTEVILALAYAAMLLAGAFALEWLSAHTHNRSQRFRTAGFTYEEKHDLWVCHQGEQLWPREFDREKRLVRYRAKAKVCNACPKKGGCTDSDEGREIVQAVDPWPHSEAGRFHRGIALMLVGLAILVLLVEVVRNHEPAEAGVLALLFGISLLAAWWLQKDFRSHPSGFPEPKPAHGVRLDLADVPGSRLHRRWAAQQDPAVATHRSPDQSNPSA